MPLVILNKAGSKWSKTIHLKPHDHSINNSQINYNIDINIDPKNIHDFLKFFVKNGSDIVDNGAYDFHCKNQTTQASDAIKNLFPQNIGFSVSGVGISVDSENTSKKTGTSVSNDSKAKKGIGKNIEIDNTIDQNDRGATNSNRLIIDFHVHYNDNVTLHQSIEDAKKAINHMVTDYQNVKAELLSLNLENYNQAQYGYTVPQKSQSALTNYNLNKNTSSLGQLNLNTGANSSSAASTSSSPSSTNTGSGTSNNAPGLSQQPQPSTFFQGESQVVHSLPSAPTTRATTVVTSPAQPPAIPAVLSALTATRTTIAVASTTATDVQSTPSSTSPAPQ